MVFHVIPADAFFKHSPEIRIRCKSTENEIVLKAIAWTEQHEEKGSEMNCFLRPSCDEERDGHLACLLGVQRMDAMIFELKDKATCTLYHHGEATISSLVPSELANTWI